MENIAAKLLYVESAKDDVRLDISILKRAAEKAGTEVIKAQREKQKQVSVVSVVCLFVCVVCFHCFCSSFLFIRLFFACLLACSFNCF